MQYKPPTHVRRSRHTCNAVKRDPPYIATDSCATVTAPDVPDRHNHAPERTTNDLVYRQETQLMHPYHGRYAPSPTGRLHVGSARTALVAWLAARRAGGQFSLRMEDLDAPRVAPGAARTIEYDMKWLGLDWDGDVRKQSNRHDRYQSALKQLYMDGHLFPCTLSRKELASIASAPHGRQAPYPSRLRPRHVAPGWFEQAAPEAAIRFRVADGTLTFDDRVCGRQEEDVSAAVGDFVLRRKDGVYAYQLAVVVDDLDMGVTEVVRGQDLLHSTARQLLLIEALGGRRPRYAHVSLVVNANGEKLCKRDRQLTMAALRDCGVRSEEVIGYLAWSLGLLPDPRPARPAELVSAFRWSLLRTRGAWMVRENLADHIKGVTRSGPASVSTIDECLRVTA